MPDGVLNLSIVDVYNNALREPVEVFLNNQTLQQNLVVRQGKPAKTLAVKNLNQSPNGLYQIEVDAPSYIAVSRFINVPADGAAALVLTLPVNKDRVVNVNCPDFAKLPEDAQRLLSGSSIASQSGAELYSSWDNLRKAGFLNLTAKAARTKLTNGQPVLSFLRKITVQLGDRLFALVDPSLHEEVLHSVTDGVFHLVQDTLHTPPAGFQPVDSFKTFDRYGNLQLTFSRNGADWNIDMDIDDAQGFEHIFQVVHNFVSNQPTHPYNIHEILVEYQEIDPGYSFDFGYAPLMQRAGSNNS